jgi:uncharacterized protein YjeT (DUF2065 family)
MIFIAKFIAVVMIVAGCFIVMQPVILRRFIDSARNGYMPYVAALTKAFAGIMLIGASSSCHIPFIVAAFGWVHVLAGITMLVLRKDIIARFMHHLVEMQDAFYKRIGITVLCLGVLLVYAI